MARVNPVAKLGGAIALALVLVLSIDWVSAAVALGLELVLLPFAGLAPRQLALRLAPLLVASPVAGAATVIWGRDAGAVLVAAGPVTVTQGSLSLGIAIALRVLAVAVPGVVLFATTDPTDLADALGQVLRLPSRFVLGGLAAMRLVGLFLEDWRSLALARRARGGGGNALGRFGSQGFALLVLSVRRGGRLATAMEAKGFGSSRPRTWARPSRFRAGDAGLLVLLVLVAAVAVTAAVLAGTWSFVLS